jgi:Predicted membrane protein (DUF2142)
VLREQRTLAALVLIFLALGGIYSAVTPIFEAGDEVWHYPFVQWLATGHGLPVQDPAHQGPWEQEGGQPPLYYVASAAATFWIDTRDLPDRLWRNPYAKIGVPLAYGDKNLVVHTSAEDFPWHNTALAVHLLRFLSLLLGAGTVILTYLLAREINLSTTPTRSHSHTPALLAAAFVALNPMFLFISASVNNDNLATALAALGLLLTVQLTTRGASTRRLLALGIVGGLGALTKVSDLALIPLALLVVAWLAFRQRDARLFIRAVLLSGLPAALLAGWWYARNLLLYGDPLAFNVWIQIAGGRPPITLLGLLNEFQGFRISFWGNFGGVNLIAPDWVYTALDALSLLALLGLVIGARRRKLPAALWIPTAWLAIIFVSLVRWTLLTYASQGRLIFPAISAVGVLLAFGLSQFKLPSLQVNRLEGLDFLTFQPVNLLTCVFLFAFALAAPFFIIAPAYALPPRLSADAPAPNPVHITYAARDGQPELVGYEVARSVRAGEELPITLYWRTSSPMADDLYVYIHLYDAGGKDIGQWEALPGNGMYPTRLWQPNELIVDRYHVPVSIGAAGQQVGRVEVGLTPVGATAPLAAHDPQGNEITPSIARFAIAPAHLATSARPALFKFGDALELVQFNVYGQRGSSEFEITPRREGAPNTSLQGGDVVRVEFTLRASKVPRADYTIFAHLVDAQGHIPLHAQWDNPPRAGTYPTSFWEAGEEVADAAAFRIPSDVPAGDYQIEFGLYRSADGMRLAVAGAATGDLRARSDHLLFGPLAVGK